MNSVKVNSQVFLPVSCCFVNIVSPQDLTLQSSICLFISYFYVPIIIVSVVLQFLFSPNDVLIIPAIEVSLAVIGELSYIITVYHNYFPVTLSPNIISFCCFCYFICNIAVLPCLQLLRRVVAGTCSENVIWPAQLSCNPYGELNIFPVDSALWLMLISWLLLVKEGNFPLQWVMLQNAFVIITLIIACAYLQSTLGANLIIIYFIFSLVFFRRLTHNREFEFPKIPSATTPQQAEVDIENHQSDTEHVAEGKKQPQVQQIEVQEMNRMIANVAHDLKTPLSSFMTGVNFMKGEIESFENTTHITAVTPTNNNNASTPKKSSSSIPKAKIMELIKNCQSCIENIEATNAFMLMTINRCIDYTKSTTGFKLIAKLETIHLTETLLLPLQCMTNIHDKVHIGLDRIPRLPCSHIITDKQWLQENILCLLSNAVKYSDGGDVMISVKILSNEEALAKFHNSLCYKEEETHLKEAQECAANDQIEDEVLMKDSAEHDHSAWSALWHFGSCTSPSAARVVPITASTKSQLSAAEVNINSRRITTRQENTAIPRSPPAISPEETAHTLRSISIHDMQTTFDANTIIGNAAGLKSRLWQSAPRRNSSLITTATSTSALIMHQQQQQLVSDAKYEEIKNSPTSRPSSAQILPVGQLYNQDFTQQIVFEVVDSGIGVSPEAAKHLFHPFQQTQRLAGGTGLGLYSLALRIEVLRGFFGVEARVDELPGSNFWFSIPFRADPTMTENISDIFLSEIDASAEKFLLANPHSQQSVIDSPVGDVLLPNNNDNIDFDRPTKLELFVATGDGTKYDDVERGQAMSVGKNIEASGLMNPFSMHDHQQSFHATTTNIASINDVPYPYRQNNSHSSLQQSHSFVAEDSGCELEDSTSSLTSSISTTPGQHSSRPLALHVLVADDSETIAKFTRMTLKRAGFEVTVVKNGKIALDKITESFYELSNGKVAYDIVLMDLQMPTMDGLEATRRIRILEQSTIHSPNITTRINSPSSTPSPELRPSSSSSTTHLRHPQLLHMDNINRLLPTRTTTTNTSFTAANDGVIASFPHVFIIGISANGDEETVSVAMHAGVDDFIIKPFELKIFQQKVKTYFLPLSS